MLLLIVPVPVYCFLLYLHNPLLNISGVTTYVIAWMLQTRSMAPSLIYMISFFLRKIIQISKQYNDQT